MSIELSCYNRGCGLNYDPDDNSEVACCFHPGLPVFHDAYKGWSCCNKKTVDFTEFLNIKGCTRGKHSNEKPPEMPKSVVDKENAHVPIEVNIQKLVLSKRLERPPFNSPMTQLVPNVAEALKQTFKDCPHNNVKHDAIQNDSGSITIGTKCKNGGCRGEFEGPQSNEDQCIHHPGVPIFHEGMKFWSCCQKRTSDFNAFLNQAGCTTGHHKWKKEMDSLNTVKCRWDWHQTGNHVVVAVYAKEYNPFNSWVKINPIRLCMQLEFPKENGAKFDLDLELRGVVDVNDCTAHMYGTKVEIKLRKAELGSWVKLDIPREQMNNVKSEDKNNTVVPKANECDDDIDLTDVEPVHTCGNINVCEHGN